MSTAVGVRPAMGSGSLSSDSESSGSDRDTGRFKVKSAVVQAGRKEASQPSSPSSSLSRTPSPLPHATFPPHPPSPPPIHHERIPSPSPPPRAKRQRERSWSPRPTRRDDRRRSRSLSPGERRRRRESPRQGRGKDDEIEEGEVREEKSPPPKKKKEEVDPIFTRTGGAYIPPAKLRMMQQQIQDKSSVAYQRIAWEALKKSINGLINKVNVSNIGNIVQELFQENVVRGRGLLVRSVLQAQAASPTFTHVYAALVAIINTKFPHIGELLAKRLIIQFRKSFQRNNKAVCVTASKFLAHLVNQMVLHEIIALELLTLLLEEPTDDSVEVAVGFLKECGLKLTEVSTRGVHAVFETLRSVLHSGQVTSRVQYMIEVMFAIRKDKFKEHPTVLPELDLVQEEDQITHLLSLGDSYDGEDVLNVFQADDDYLTNEEKYKEIKAEILGEGSSGSEESSGDESDDEESEEEDEEGQEEGEKMDITDKTDAKALSLRRTIYLTIMSSLDFEECAHKLLKTKEEGQEPEIAMMLVECCSQERSYLRFFGLLGQRFCMLNKLWVEAFDYLFQEQYATVHRLETNKLRNVAKFFAQLFYSDALPWTGMSCIHLNEEETNSSSRIFVKILFQELAEFMGIARLNERLRDPLLAEAFESLLPRDNPKNTRFAINFFTSIGLGGLTDDLREHLKNVQKQIMAQKQEVSSSDTSSSGSESDSSESGSSSESSEESESSEDSEEERKRRRERDRERDKEKRGRGRKEVEEKRERRKERRKRRSGSEDSDAQSSWRRRDRDEDEREQRRDRDRSKKKETDRRYSSRDKGQQDEIKRKEDSSIKSQKKKEDSDTERRRDRKRRMEQEEGKEREDHGTKEEERDERKDRGRDRRRPRDNERDLKERDVGNKQRSRGDRSRGERGRERRRSRERDRERSSSPGEGQRKR